MDLSAKYCRFCGSTIGVDSKYCENCGAPVAHPSPAPHEQIASNQQVQPLPTTDEPGPRGQADTQFAPPPVLPQSLQPSYAPPPQKPKAKKPNTCLVILGVIGIALICLSVGAVLFSMSTQGAIHEVLQVITKKVSENEIPVQNTGAESTSTPLAEPSPTPPSFDGYMPLVIIAGKNDYPQTPYPSVEEIVPEITAQPVVTETRFVDDFSTTTFGWSQSSSDISSFDYDLAQGLYYIHVKKPAYISWSEVPVEFSPEEIEFDAINPGSSVGGSFGVMCQIQSQITFYNVEIDLDKMVFSIAMVVDETYIPLTNPEWLDLKNIDPTAGKSNHYRVSCQLDRVRLFANGDRIGKSDFSGRTPFSTPGKAAIFVATWDNVSADGYRVFFDNVNAWLP